MKIISLVISMLLPLTHNIHAQNSSNPTYQKVISNKYKITKNNTDTLRNTRGIIYFFDLQMGPLLGNKDRSITFTSSTISGVAIGKKLRTGIGLGFDSYTDWHIAPIFGSLSWDVFGNKNSNALFVQVNYGITKAWQTSSFQEYGFNHVTGGTMKNVQLGYRIKYHDVKVSFSAGLKSQRVFTYFEYPVAQGFTNSKTVREDMNRVLFSVIIGWQ